MCIGAGGWGKESICIDVFGCLTSFCKAAFVPLGFDAEEVAPVLPGLGLVPLFFFEEVALLVRRFFASPLPCFLSFDVPLLLVLFLLVDAEDDFRFLATKL